MSDHTGAALLFDSLPEAKVLLGDKGYDSDWLRTALAGRGIEACIPPLRHRKVQHVYDKQLYRQRHKIENVFARIVNGTVKIPGSGKVKFPTLRFGFSGGLCGASIFGWASAASRLDGRGWRNQGVGPDVLGQQIGMPAQAVT